MLKKDIELLRFVETMFDAQTITSLFLMLYWIQREFIREEQ